MAARRSREARRLKENQIALRVAHLERENDGLRQKVESAQFEMTKLTNVRDVLRRKLRQFEWSEIVDVDRLQMLSLKDVILSLYNMQ